MSPDGTLCTRTDRETGNTQNTTETLHFFCFCFGRTSLFIITHIVVEYLGNRLLPVIFWTSYSAGKTWLLDRKRCFLFDNDLSFRGQFGKLPAQTRLEIQIHWLDWLK